MRPPPPLLRRALAPALALAAILAGALPDAGAAGPADGKARTAPAPARIGTARAVAVVPDLAAAPRRDGRTFWSHTFTAPGASFLKPHFAGVNLRAGDVLRLRAGDGRLIEEVTGRGPRDLGSFWGLSAFGERLTLELATAHAYPAPPFTVDRLIVGEPGAFDAPAGGLETVCGPADFEDAVCYQGDPQKWANLQATVGVMTVGGNPNSALFCTGTNVSGAGRVLTNAHCLETQGQCDGAELVFGFHRLGCGGGAPTTEWRGFRCGEVLATSPFGSCDATPAALDFTLVSVVGDPSTDFGQAVADPAPLVDGEAVYIPQHPRGRPKEIVHGSGGDVEADGIVLRYFGTLDTEPGSSGAPVFRESDDRLIALHHCGGCDSGEGNRATAMSEVLPHIEEHLCTEALTVTAGGVDDLAEVAGNGDGVIDAGEVWRFTPRVRNTSCELAAAGVTAAVALGAGTAPGVTLLDTAVSFGDVAAGASAPASAPVRFAVGAATPCGGAVAFDLVELAATNGGPFADAPGVVEEAVGELVKTVLFSEDFAGGLAGGWSVVDGGTGSGPAATWTTANPGERLLPLAEPFAIADSDELGIGQVMDEQLISPVLAAAGFAQLELQLAHQFNWYPLGIDERGDVDVRSAATGGAWVNVARFAGARRDGTDVFDLTPWAAGQSDLQFRFRYSNARFEWWWAVDDVYLLGNDGYVCHPFLPDVFADGFESGDLSAWSAAVGGP